MSVQRILMAMVAAGAAAIGCGGDPATYVIVNDVDPAGDVACRIVSSTPAFGATGVSVRAPLAIQWSEPIDLASVAPNVELEALGGATIPVSIEQTGPKTVVLHPQRSLWFWEAYTLVVGEGVTTDGGAPCAGEEIAFGTLEPEALPRDLRPASADGIAKVGDFVLVASGGYRGLQIYDVSNPEATKLVGEVPTDQSPMGLTVSGSRAYAPAGVEGVLVFDVSNPAAPVQIGRAGTPGIALDAAEFSIGGRLYLAVADFWEGVRILDVTDPAGPKDLGAIDPTTTGQPFSFGVDVQGTLLAVADGNAGIGGIALVDVADPEKPVVLSSIQDDYASFDIALDGTIAYTSRGPLGTRAWDVSDPTAPVVLASLPGPSSTSFDRVQRLVLDGGELFAATGTVGVERVSLDGKGGMAMASVHDVPGRAWSVAVDGTHIYVGAEAGLLVYERNAPSGAPPIWFDENGHGLAREVALADGYAYVAAGSRGLQTFAIGEDGAPELVDRDDTPGMALDVAAGSLITTEDLVVLGDARGGIVLFDRTNPADPTPVGFIDNNDAVQGMQVVGTTLFACDSNKGMLIADISSPGAPIVLSNPQSSPPEMIACLDLLVIGDVALLGSNEGLGLVDVSDLTQPKWLGWAKTSEIGSIGYLKLVGNHLLASFRIADYEGTYDVSRELLVFDVSDPAAPELVWASGDLGGTGEIAVAGDVAFMAGGNRGVFVFDVADVTEPKLEGAIATQGNANGLALAERTLYVAQGQGGLIAIPVGDLPEH